MEKSTKKILESLLPTCEDPQTFCDSVLSQDGQTEINAILEPLKNMWDNIRLKFGKKDSYLFYAVGGSFASEAWMKGDKEFHEIAGTSFQAITSDDGGQYNINKYGVQRINSFEEFKTLWDNSCDVFKFVVNLYEHQPKFVKPSTYIDWLGQIKCVKFYAEKFSIREICDYFSERYGYDRDKFNVLER